MGSRAADLTGAIFGRLTVLERANPDRNGNLKWLCRCLCGNSRAFLADNLRRGHSQSCGCLHKERIKASNHRGDDVSYTGAHLRTRRERGSASGYTCVDCAGAAREWSLKLTAAKVLIGTSGGFTLAYSPDPMDYEPRCTPCHRRFDARRR